MAAPGPTLGASSDKKGQGKKGTKSPASLGAWERPLYNTGAKASWAASGTFSELHTQAALQLNHVPTAPD